MKRGVFAKTLKTLKHFIYLYPLGGGQADAKVIKVNRKFTTIPTMWKADTFHAFLQHCAAEGLEIHEALDDILNEFFKTGFASDHISPVDSDKSHLNPNDDFKSSISQLSAQSIDFNSIETVDSERDLNALVRAQAPRNFPCKVILRVLAKLSQDGLAPSLESFLQNALHHGRIFRQHFRSHETDPQLSNIHEFNQKISSGFPKVEGEISDSKTPSEKRDVAEKSEQRFSNVYIANVRKSDGYGSGILFELGLIEIDSEYPHNVHLTEDGLNFVLLENPILDRNTTRGLTLSEEEIGFLIRHYRDRLPIEWQFLTNLSDILDESVGMSQIRPKLMSQYRNEWVDREGNPLDENRLQSRVDSIAGSAINRLEEMGLVEKKRVPKFVQGDDRNAPLRFVRSTSTDRVNYRLSEQGGLIILNREE